MVKKEFKKSIPSKEVTLFVSAMVVTILVARIVVWIHDPDITIRGYELHHFYYGIVLLVIASLYMLFGKGKYQISLVVTAIAIGLIIDEFIFVLGNLTKNMYPTTFASVVVGILLIVACIILLKKIDI